MKDKQTALKSSRLVSVAPVSLAEDVSRRTKESRAHLRRFLRHVRRHSPEKVSCDWTRGGSRDQHVVQVTRLEYDVALVDGVEFVYSEERRLVEARGAAAAR